MRSNGLPVAHILVACGLLCSAGLEQGCASSQSPKEIEEAEKAAADQAGIARQRARLAREARLKAEEDRRRAEDQRRSARAILAEQAKTREVKQQLRREAQERAERLLEELRGLGEVDRDESHVWLTLPTDRFFHSWDATLRRQSHATLDRLAEVLRQLTQVRMLVVGRISPRDLRWHSPRLTLDRADVMRDYLVSRGVPPQHIFARMQIDPSEADDSRTRGRFKPPSMVIVLERVPELFEGEHPGAVSLFAEPKRPDAHELTTERAP